MTRFCFDHFCLDSEQKLLCRGDEPVHLTPRAFRLLEHLLAQSPKAVSKRELLDHVWSGLIVEEANLKTLVLEIRSSLHERGGHANAIRTIYGFGYSFSEAVHIEMEPVRSPLVVLRWAGGVARLSAGAHVIGRSAGCTVVIDAPSVSREHAQLTVSRDALRLTDLDSKNGTSVDGSRIHGTADLLSVCRILIGEIAVDVSRLETDVSTETLDAVEPV
jgi:DNA-binding winged helix-turn-helix (wHTH) protein